MSNKYLEKVAEVKKAPLTVDVYRYGRRKKTYDANKYLTKIKPKQEAKTYASRAGLVGAGTGLALGALSPKGAKAKLVSAVKSGLVAGATNAGLTGVISYRQAKQKGREHYKHLLSASKRQK